MSADPNPYRTLPKIDVLADDNALVATGAPHALRVMAARQAVESAREAVALGSPMTADDVAAAACAMLGDLLHATLRPVINATGVVVHTNLGRAPLPPEALTAALRYSTLEYDLARGARGSRRVHATALIQHLSGAEAALVVNNNAAAVVLMLATIAGGAGNDGARGEVIISRGELIEIGGSFRVPEIMEASGARLVEVGTTNKTYARDYAAAVGPNTRAILRVHPSNYRVVGFTHAPTTAELPEVAHAHELPLLYDGGAATFGPLPERLVDVVPRDELDAGADLVSFSGDKILGGPQAGLLLGAKRWIDRCAKHPLARAFRADKLTLAALQYTLRAHLLGDSDARVPVSRMVNATADALEHRAKRVAERLRLELPAELAGVAVVPCEDAVGGGSHPELRIAGAAVAISMRRDAARLAEALRRPAPTDTPPVIGVVADGDLRLHLRTVDSDEEDALVSAVATAFSSLTP